MQSWALTEIFCAEDIVTNNDKEKVVEALSELLANSYTLYLKTHNYHWNVTGPMFTTLHTLFETQYNDLALAVDEIAERIRALGAYAPASYSEFQKLASVQEETGHPKAEDMIRNLVSDSETLVKSAKKLIDAAEPVGDDVGVDLGTRRTEVHQKNAWMLQSHLE